MDGPRWYLWKGLSAQSLCPHWTLTTSTDLLCLGLPIRSGMAPSQLMAPLVSGSQLSPT